MSPKPAKLWWVYLDRRVQGPYPLQQIAQIPGISERTRVCADGTNEWKTLAELADESDAAPPTEAPLRRCPNCSRKARAGAKYCEHCGTLVGEGAPAAHGAKPAGPSSVGGRLLTAATLLGVAAAAAFSWKVLEDRKKAEEPTGRIVLAVEQIVHAKTLRDVRGEERTPLPGKRFCLVTVSVRNPDLAPALFNRAGIKWRGPDGKAVELDGLTQFLPNELIAAPRLEPRSSIQGRVVFQVPESSDRFQLLYGASAVAVPPALLDADRRWRGREDAAARAVRAYKCKGPEGKPVPLDPNTVLEPRQELGPLYHVDAEDYSFHVDLSNSRITPAPDADTLITENTRRDCF